MRFVHVATRTKNLDAAISFYELLGLRLSHKRDLEQGKATLAFMEQPESGFRLELVYNWGKDDAYASGERFGHFAFEVEDLDRLYEDLLAAGAGDVDRPPTLLEGTGPNLAFVTDPDGNWVELIER